ncbi:hypothetical protein M5F04_07510 [Acinetobacter sp. ANC 7200]|uniref:hypothetical protein n=1 Tax=Acinetobacter amyesii TaxID=2942470 RepID=UPI0020C1540F|nr:hypothetical protein [Acinetobacter amyesii]MCL6244405.1 hypothetical protein [Acinetobacter amyesii]
MSRNIKRQIVFFLIVLFCVITYNYIATRQAENMELNSNVQERERAFMLKRAEYIKNHGATSIAEQEIHQELAFKSGHALMNSSSSYQIVEKQALEQSVK